MNFFFTSKFEKSSSIGEFGVVGIIQLKTCFRCACLHLCMEFNFKIGDWLKKLIYFWQNNNHVTACKPGMFKCNNNHCIEAKRRCDQVNDCNDRSDEANCAPRNKNFPWNGSSSYFLYLSLYFHSTSTLYFIQLLPCTRLYLSFSR